MSGGRHRGLLCKGAGGRGGSRGEGKGAPRKGREEEAAWAEGRVKDAMAIQSRVVPLHDAALAASGRKTGRVFLLSDAVEGGGVMHTVAANLPQLCFDDLDAPPVVVGSRNWITPAAELETLFFPQAYWVLDAIHERILQLKGYQARTNQSLGELVRRARAGV